MDKIYKLTDLIDKDLAEDNLTEAKREEIAEEMNWLLPDGAIVLAQANPISGWVEYNAKKAAKWINQRRKKQNMSKSQTIMTMS